MVKKLKYYVLTSNHFQFLKRHISEEYSNIPKEDLVVVINTLDEDYLMMAKGFCIHKEIEYYVTESDGTPATGKNSVLDLFLKSDNDYMVLIDGDDYLSQHGVWVYKHLSQLESPPDAVCLHAQKGYLYTPDGVGMQGHPFCLDYRKMIYTDWDAYYSQYVEDKKLAEKWADNALFFWKFQYKYSEPHTQNCRVTFMSRKAAQVKFPTGLYIGEDTLQYFLLKNKHVLGELNMVKSVEEPPTYIYDQRLGGTVCSVSQYGQDASWMGKYVEFAKEYEKQGVVHEYELPDLYVDYPVGYDCGDAEFGSGALYDCKDEETGEMIIQFYYPVNASDKSLIAEQERILKIYAED